MSATSELSVGIVGLALFCGSILGSAQTNLPMPIAAKPVIAVVAAPVAPSDLPKGASDVVKLAHMGKKDNVLIFYINYSELDYHLNANHVIYLKAAGLSHDVINAMLDIDREHQKALAVRSDEDRFFGRTDIGNAQPVPAAPAAPAMESKAEYIPSVIYPDYSAFPTYYQTFDNSDRNHASVAIGIGVGAVLGFGDAAFHGFYRGHFGGRH